MIRNTPARVPLWLAKRQWRDAQPMRIDRCRPELRDRLQRQRWRAFHTFRYHWRDKRGPPPF